MKRWMTVLYVICVVAILALPGIMTNNESDQVSMVDNKALMTWQSVITEGDVTDNLEQYINDRIGFRESAIKAFARLNDEVFHILANPRFMYGQEGHIYFADDTYIRDFQHLNTEPEKGLVDSFAGFLNRTNEYCDQKGIEFIYFLVPDKKTIYPEYFPKGINVNDAIISRTDYFLSVLQNAKFPYVYPREQFLKAKKEQELYNQKYDTVHWNQFGAFLGHSLLDTEIRNHCSNPMIPLNREDYEVSYTEVQDGSGLRIFETVPQIELKNKSTILDVSEKNELNAHPRYFTHYINENIEGAPKLMVFCDSYLYGGEKFYTERYKEVIFLHNSRNVSRIQEFIDYYQPDILVFENVERVMDVDYSEEMLTNITFENVK